MKWCTFYFYNMNRFYIYNIIMDSTCQDYGLPISIPVYFSGGPSEKVDEEGE